MLVPQALATRPPQAYVVASTPPGTVERPSRWNASETARTVSAGSTVTARPSGSRAWPTPGTAR